MFDKYFDTLNVSNFTNGKVNRKPFQSPFRSSEDFRLKVANTCMWYNINFDVVFIKFILSVVRKGVSSLPPCEQKQMLLSRETLLGLRMTGK